VSDVGYYRTRTNADEREERPFCPRLSACNFGISDLGNGDQVLKQKFKPSRIESALVLLAEEIAELP
jgi:hypothetical protein